jgi:hypothetical protein
MKCKQLSNNYKLKTNTQNYKNNIQPEKKQLIKTPELSFLTTHLKVANGNKGVLTNCFMMEKLLSNNYKTNTQNYKNFNNNNNNQSTGRVVINGDDKKNVVNQNSMLSKKYNTFKRSFN